MLLRDYPEHASTVSDIQWIPAGAGSKRPLLPSAAFGQLIFWDPESEEPVNRLEWKGSLLAIAWSPNGNFVASGNQDSTVHFWFIEGGEDLQMTGYPAEVRELSWDFTSRYLATGGGDQITVWDCSGKGPAGSKPIVLKGHQAPLRCLAYQPRGRVLASGADDGMVGFWHPDRQSTPIAIQVFDHAVAQIAWSPDSGCLAAGSHGGILEIIPMLER